MLKTIRPVSMLLLLAGLPTSLTHAGITHRNVVEQIQQNNPCTGIVKDASGETIIGASVVVKGTTNGTITDLNGEFSLSNITPGTTIQISYIGYKDIEMVWNGSPLNVILQEDTKVLDEVVVVGFGTQKKINLTGAVSTVDTKVLESRPVSRSDRLCKEPSPD